MNRKCKYGIAFLFGLLACVNVACNSSAEAKNAENSSMTETQNAVSEYVATETTDKHPLVLSEEQFKQLVVDFTSSNKSFKGKKPCVIDFYADWCGPCRRLVPTFEKMAEKYSNKVDFYKVNVDYAKNLSAAYRIQSIPTLFFFSKKGTLTQMIGLPNEEELENAINTIL